MGKVIYRAEERRLRAGGLPHLRLHALPRAGAPGAEDLPQGSAGGHLAF